VCWRIVFWTRWVATRFFCETITTAGSRYAACHIAKTGASGICFVGDPQAARNPLFNYSQVNKLEDLDRTPGPRTQNYPADCLVEDCLIYLTGRVEKQTAGVDIRPGPEHHRPPLLYLRPAARGDQYSATGCWGGHVIEFCDVFDTVKETGDHGSFNSWGRDRYWRPNIAQVNAWVQQVPELPRLDAVKPVILPEQPLALRPRLGHRPRRRFLFLHHYQQSLSARRHQEPRRGMDARWRTTSQLIPVCTLTFGLAASGDIFRRNIVWREYQPALMPTPPGARNWTTTSCTVKAHERPRNPAPCAKAAATTIPSWPTRSSLIRRRETTGSRRDLPLWRWDLFNFSMDAFGVQRPALKSLARTPVLPAKRP